MQDITYTYHTSHADVTICGFIASLLLQGDQWDIRQLEADIRDYHHQQYERIHPIIALRQELQWWYDFVDDELLYDFPLRDELANAGLIYLHAQAKQHLTPLSDADKLATEMEIYIDDTHYFYKLDDALALFEQGSGAAPTMLLKGFPAQLLTYAACTTMDTYIRQDYIADPVTWVDNMIGWLQSPAAITVQHLQFDLPDVYSLYESYVVDARARREAENRKRYESGEPQKRYFMTHLLQQTQEDCQEAQQALSAILNPMQYAALLRYMAQVQQYIRDHTQTKRKVRSDKLSQYYTISSKYPHHMITRRLHEAAMHPTEPAAALAKVVKQLQAKKRLGDIRPHSHFIAVVNKTFATSIKQDSFSKHFRK